jgi:hypothetical protein
MVPGDTLLGAACTSRFRLLPTCRWLSWSVPASAIIKGVYKLDWEPNAPSWLSVSTLLKSGTTEGGSGLEGMRHVRGASLWM